MKPDAPPTGPRSRTYRKPLAIERYRETHAVLTDEQLDAVFDGLAACGLVGGEE